MAKSITANAPELSPPDSQPDSPTSAFGTIRRWTWRSLIFVMTGLLLFLAWLVANGDLYKPGSQLGYNLGLAGGVMMLTLLLYPLRKRIPWLEQSGSMKAWFRYHMVFGIAGPVLILFHTTFHPASMNARVALYAMVLVAVSGIVGRFVYRQAHLGLYGRELTLADSEAELKASSEGIDSAFVLQPEILQRLKAFRETALTPLEGIDARAWRFCTLRWQGKMLIRSVRSAVKQALLENAKRKNWTRSQTKLSYLLGMKQIARYVDAVCKTARYSTWNYLFSFWQLIHVPLLYVLVFSAITHVVAVHMY